MHRTPIYLAALLLAGSLLIPEALAQPAHRSTDASPTRQPVAAQAMAWSIAERRGALTIYPNRAAFDAAHPGLPVEDFEDLAVPPGSWCTSPSPADANSNNGCVSAGDLAEGLAIAAVGPAQNEPDALVAWDGGTFSNPSIAFGANFFADDTEVRFAPGVAAAAMDVYAIGGGAVLVSVFDTSDNLLASATVSAPALRFVGVSSATAPIGRVHFGLPEDLLLVDNVAFGGAASCALDLAATINTTTANQGDQITFDVSITNTTTMPVQAALRLIATGPANQTLNFGTGTVPAGVSVSRPFRVRIPQAAPNGTYDLVLDLDADGQDCDSETFSLTVTAPRIGATGATAFERVDGDFFATAEAVVNEVGVAPNPFVNQTVITFEVGEAAQARLAIYDVLGREVAVLVDGRVEEGVHTATFDARGLAAGTYVYRLQVGGNVQTGRMTLAR